MIFRFVLFLFLSLPVRGGGWEISVGFLAGASAADTVSSWGRQELNPVLGRGRFGKSHLGRKCAITGLSLGLQVLAIRRDRKLKKLFTVSNLVSAAVLTGVAIRNSH
jgi:hypothetical protein